MNSLQCAFRRVVAIVLLSVFAPSVWANSAPSFAHIDNSTLTAGQLFHVTVQPVDADGTVPGIFVDSKPEGSEFVDNRNGTRTFRWTPSSEQLGEHRVLFVAVDALDQSLRFSQEVFLRVESADGSPPPRDAAVPTAAPVAATTATTTVTEDVVIDGNRLPVLEVQTNVNMSAGESMALRVKATDVDGGVPGLVAHAMPAGATFSDNGDGTRSIAWTPDRWQTGTFEIVVVAIDASRNDHRVQQTVRINVAAPSEPAVASDAVDAAPPPAAVAEAPPPPPVPDSLPAPEALVDLPGNQAPFFRGLGNQTVSIGDTLRFVVAPVDPDGDVPGMFADRIPYNSSFRDNFDGTRTLVWSPYPADRGDYWINFTAVDAQDNSLRTNQSIKITVEDNGGYNFSPVINGINNPVIRAGDTLRQLVQPVDPDGDIAQLSVLNPPAGSSFVDNEDGTRTLWWTTSPEHITERDGVDNPHIIDFLAVDPRDPNLRDDHQLKVSVVEPSSLDRSGERLRVLAEQRGLLIGFAAMLNSSKLADADVYLDIASREFNIVTPENSHKWGWIHPERGQFRFEDADELADYAARHGMQLHGHPLLWHRQLPGWVQNLELGEVEQVMNEHIDALASRYRGRVHIWDVVNEAFEEDGTFRDSIWHQAMGEGFINKAFRRARERDPNAELIYNDYDVAWFGPKSDAMYNMLRRELADGTPIDGVGFQMHFWTAFDGYDETRRNLQRFADLGLDIYITEFDVAYTAEGQEEQQATVYENIARICIEQPRCRALQAWGFTDRYSWRYANKPLLFTERYKAKPAYFAWQRALSR